MSAAAAGLSAAGLSAAGLSAAGLSAAGLSACAHADVVPSVSKPAAIHPVIQRCIIVPLGDP
ncbi:MAG: hypothetical protein KF718_11495 [Polyangiaceae bacterium]|nr:hypothetical protein [Polyangiaceae bacterium]